MQGERLVWYTLPVVVDDGCSTEPGATLEPDGNLTLCRRPALYVLESGFFGGALLIQS